MPGQMAAAHGACRSGGVFPQYSSLWSGVLPRVLENPDGAATRKYFPASRFRRSVTQWGSLNRRMNRFFLARPVFSLMLGAPDRPHDAMTGPGLISLFCFLMTAAYFLRGGMCAGAVLCMGLAFFSFSRRGWLRRSVTSLLQASLLFWGAEAWRLARLWMMEGGPFLLWTSIPAAALLLHAAAILWRRRGEKNLPVPELARSRVFSVSVLLLFLLDALVPFRLLMGERILPWQGGQWAGDSSPGLVGRLLRGRFVESADVSAQAAGDVDRVCLRFFSPVSAGSDGGFLPADDGEAPYSRAVYDDFRPGLPGRRVFHAGIVQRIRPYGREFLVQPFVLLRGVGLPGRRFFPQEGASGAGWEKSL